MNCLFKISSSSNSCICNFCVSKKVPQCALFFFFFVRASVLQLELYKYIRCTSAQQSNTKSCLTSRLSYQPKVSLLPFFTPTTYSFSATQSSMPSDCTTATRTVWFEEEKTFFNFCTVSTRRLLLHTSNPSPSLHQFTNYLKNPVGSSSITFVCCIMLGRILFFIKKAQLI